MPQPSMPIPSIILNSSLPCRWVYMSNGKHLLPLIGTIATKYTSCLFKSASHIITKQKKIYMLNHMSYAILNKFSSKPGTSHTSLKYVVPMLVSITKFPLLLACTSSPFLIFHLECYRLFNIDQKCLLSCHVVSTPTFNILDTRLVFHHFCKIACIEH